MGRRFMKTNMALLFGWRHESIDRKHMKQRKEVAERLALVGIDHARH